MPCPCLVVSLVVSPIAACLGIETPQTWKGRVISVLITSAATALTVLALKHFFNFAVCGNSGSLVWKVFRAAVITVPMSFFYAFPIGVLVARLEKRFMQPSLVSNEKQPLTSNCCHSHLPGY